MSDPASVWDRKYAVQQKDTMYLAQDSRLKYQSGDQQAMLAACLGDRKSGLDPPDLFRYSALLDFTTAADILDLAPGRIPPTISEDTEVVLLDDRRDPTSKPGPWDQQGNAGCTHHATQGEVLFSGALSIPGFVERLNEKVRNSWLT